MDFTLKKDNIYQQLKEGILGGTYVHLSKLPPEAKFCQELGVGRITLRDALKRLEEDKLIKRIPAKGTFVINPKKVKTNKILIIHGDLNDFSNAQIDIIPGIESAAVQAGLQAVRCNYKILNQQYLDSDFSSFKKDEILGVVALMTSLNGDELILEALQKLNRPVVLPIGNLKDQQISGFAAIIRQQGPAWKTALKYLIEQGHRKIGFVTNAKYPFLRGINEKEHFEFLNSLGACSSPELLKRITFNEKSVINATEELMNISEPPTAIMCHSDQTAFYVYQALDKEGLRVPEDIAVMGFGGIDEAVFYQPPLTTMDCEYFNCGTMSVKILLNSDEWFGKEDVSPPIIYKPYNLIVRESTAVKRVEYQFV